MKKLLMAAICLAPVFFFNSAQSKAFTPEGILPEGVDSTVSVNPFTGESGFARKGTVAATLNNVALLNSLLQKNSDAADLEEIRKITEAIEQLLPSLKVIGVFDLFTIQEWIATDYQPGRIYAALLYLKKYPECLDEAIVERLKKIKQTTSSDYLRSQIHLSD